MAALVRHHACPLNSAKKPLLIYELARLAVRERFEPVYDLTSALPLVEASALPHSHVYFRKEVFAYHSDLIAHGVVMLLY